MAFTGSAVCTSFFTDLLNGVFNFGTHTFKVALYTSSATLDATTTAYTATNEVAASGGYSTGGTAVAVTVSSVSTANGTVVIVDIANAVWATSTITARGALLYDDTPAGNNAVMVLDFGTDRSSTSSTFTVSFADVSNGVGPLVFGSFFGA